MIARSIVWTAAWLALAAIASPQAVLADKGKGKDDAKRRQRQELERKIDQTQHRLNALNHEESALHKQVQALEKGLPGTRENLRKAESDAKEAEASLKAARDALEKAKDSLGAAKQKLDALEEELENGQPSGSPLAQAKAAYLAAKTACTEAVDKVTDSAEYKQAYERAKGTPSLFTVRKQWIDENPAIAAAQDKLKDAKAAYDTVRLTVFQANSSWQKSSGAQQDAQRSVAQIEKDALGAAGRNVSSKRRAEQLHAEVRAMEANLSRARNELKGLPGKRDSLRRELENHRHALARLR